MPDTIRRRDEGLGLDTLEIPIRYRYRSANPLRLCFYTCMRKTPFGFLASYSWDKVYRNPEWFLVVRLNWTWDIPSNNLPEISWWAVMWWRWLFFKQRLRNVRTKRNKRPCQSRAS